MNRGRYAFPDPAACKRAAACQRRAACRAGLPDESRVLRFTPDPAACNVPAACRAGMSRFLQGVALGPALGRGRALYDSTDCAFLDFNYKRFPRSTTCPATPDGPGCSRFWRAARRGNASR